MVWFPDAKTVSTFATVTCLVQARFSCILVLGKEYASHDPMICRISWVVSYATTPTCCAAHRSCLYLGNDKRVWLSGVLI
jgi:hypothetical protein